MDTDQPSSVPRREPERNNGGKWVEFSGASYLVPPLNFRALRELQDKIAKLGTITGTPTGEQMKVVSEIVHAALARNYPQMTVKNVEEMIDLGNFMPVMDAVLNIAGLRRLAPGEGTVQP